MSTAGLDKRATSLATGKLPHPQPTTDAMILAYKILDEAKPPGVRLDGVAYQSDGMEEQWSANYSVVSTDFPEPKPDACSLAEAGFQKHCPDGGTVHRTVIVALNIGGALLRKWQVYYSG